VKGIQVKGNERRNSLTPAIVEKNQRRLAAKKFPLLSGLPGQYRSG
jgi:hypothetical protein